MDNGYRVVVDPTPESFSYTQNSLLPKNTIFFLQTAVFWKKNTAFLKNVEAFEAKRPDVFLKRLGVGSAGKLHHKIHHFLL